MFRSRSRVPFRIGSVAALAALVVSCGSVGGGDDKNADSLKIGLLVPASGVYESLGEDMTRGFELYLDQHDGKLGGKDVELIKADEGEGPHKGLPAAKKLIDKDDVSAIAGVVSSATAEGLKDTVKASEVPLIIANAGADDVADGSPYVWRTSFTNGGVAASLGEKVADETDDGSAYILVPDYDAGHEDAEAFKEAFTEAGGTIAGESFTPFGETSDWQPYLSKVQSSGADAIYTFYAGAEAVKFVQQYNSFGLSESVPIYGSGFLTEGGVLDAQGSDAKGIFTSLHYSNLLDTPKNEEFVEAYTDAYDVDSAVEPTVYAVQAYDAAGVLDLALKESESVDGPSIADALDEVGTIDSPRGEWSFDENHNPAQTYFLRQVREQDDGYGNVVLTELTD